MTNLPTQDHIHDENLSEWYKLDDKQLDSKDVLICHECETYIVTSKNTLKNHTEKKHVGTCTKTNFELSSEILFCDINTVKIISVGKD